MQAVQIVQGTAVPLDRSDVDTDQIIPAEWLKRVERTGFGKGLFSSWRDDRSLRAQRRAVRRRQHPRGRPQLRHRLVPGARRVGDHGLRLPGRGQPPLRRHLPQQLHEERARAGAGERRGRRAAPARPSRPTRPSSSPSTSSAARCPRRPSASRSSSPSTTPPASASSRASTTSASPSAARTPSPTSSRPAPPGSSQPRVRPLVVEPALEEGVELGAAGHLLRRGR